MEPIGSVATAMIDQMFDFINGETEEEAHRAELWFDSALSCAPSPSVPRIKARRSFKVETMCNFDEEEEQDNMIKDKESLELVVATLSSQPELDTISKATKGEVETTETTAIEPSHSSSKDTADASIPNDKTAGKIENKENIPPPPNTEACTPKPPLQSSQGGKSMDLTARKIASLLRNPSALRPKKQSLSSHPKGTNQNISILCLCHKEEHICQNFRNFILKQWLELANMQRHLQ